MKKILFGLALLTMLGAITACDDSGGSGDLGFSPPPPANPVRMVFNAQYVHTQYVQGISIPGTWTSNIEYPTVSIISSRAELEQYCADYEDQYDFSRYQYSPTGFMDAIRIYSDAYFADSFLVLVLLEETSGSNRHRVERVEGNGDIAITRLLPEIGTSDMAQWHIIIELNNDGKLEQFQAVFIDCQYCDIPTGSYK